jgi:aminopeptidase N
MAIHVLIATFALSAALAAAPTAVAAPFDFDATPGQLPKSVLPLAYAIALVPDLDAGTLTGKEVVTLKVRSATDRIVLNTLNEALSDVRFDGAPIERIDTDEARQTTTLSLLHQARSGRHTLTFSYAGRLETQPHGLFLQPYTLADGRRDRMLSTKLESTDARRMFPCWDEPVFRATFELTVTIPADWAAISNMPLARRVVRGQLATVTFRRSPRMPSYLVEFSAGHLAELSTMQGPTRLGIWAPRGREPDGARALANAREILADYNDYFGFPYPLPKLDAIAVPGGFSGAMENWGAITYNDQLLLAGATSTVTDQQRVYSVQAHEMAHQWNGDLVTMAWWDELWLNESFASWRSASETDQRHPTWKWQLLHDEDRDRAMRDDARAHSHPIHQPVADELQAANAFDSISYRKGPAVLRMLEAYLGPDVFRDGIRRYMRARAFSNSTATDLWNALSAVSGRRIDDIAGDWTEQAGYPLIKMSTRCDAGGQRTLELRQSRFLLHATDTGGSRWRVPLRIRSGSAAAARPLLLTEDGQTAAAGRCEEPLSLNADALGFFRVAYDDATLATNTRQFAVLPEGDQIALLDDSWALVLAEQLPLSAYLALASAMQGSVSTRGWQQVAEALRTIEYDVRGQADHAAFLDRARSILRPVAARLGWKSAAAETPDVGLLRHALIGDLAAWNDADVLQEARRQFAAFVADHNAIRADDQGMVLAAAMHAADARTFEALHSIAESESDDTARRRYYEALMRVGDPALAAQAASIALSNEIPPQAANSRIGLLTLLAQEHPALAWSAFSENADSLLATNPKYAPLITTESVPQIFWDAVPVEQLEGWIRARVPAEMSPNVDRGIEGARARLAERSVLTRAIER